MYFMASLLLGMVAYETNGQRRNRHLPPKNQNPGPAWDDIAMAADHSEPVTHSPTFPS